MENITVDQLDSLEDINVFLREVSDIDREIKEADRENKEWLEITGIKGGVEL